MARIARHLVAALLAVYASSAARAGAQTVEVSPPDAPRAAASPRLLAPLPDVQGPRPERSWYGWQVWAADAASLALAYACASKSGGDGCLWTVTGYLVGGPIIHGVHNGPERVLGSLALRIGAPILAAYIGGAVVDCSDTYDNFCAVGAAFTGLAVGAAAAIILDGVLAIDNGTPSPRPNRARSVTPTFSVAGGNTVLGVVGRF